MTLTVGDHLVIKRGDTILTDESGESHREFRVEGGPEGEAITYDTEDGETFTTVRLRVVT